VYVINITCEILLNKMNVDHPWALWSDSQSQAYVDGNLRVDIAAQSRSENQWALSLRAQPRPLAARDPEEFCACLGNAPLKPINFISPSKVSDSVDTSG
jgi:hypothetical protein